MLFIQTIFMDNRNFLLASSKGIEPLSWVYMLIISIKKINNTFFIDKFNHQIFLDWRAKEKTDLQ